MKSLRRPLSALLATAAFAATVPALAQPAPYVPAPGRPIASGDDASSIAYNPANLAFMPGAELRWTMFRQGSLTGSGHAFDLGLPFWSLATGLRLDLIQTGSAFNVTSPWLRWDVASRLGDTLAFGTTFAWSFSGRFQTKDTFSVTSALTWRPATWLSAAVVARDWSITDNRSYDLGVALRPAMGRRGLEIGLETSIRERDGSLVPRATVGVDVPYVGRLRGEVRVIDATNKPEIEAMAGLDVNWGALQAGGGGIFGSALGNASAGYWATAALRGWRDPGLPSTKRVVRLRIEETPGVRGHVHLLQRLWKMARDPEVAGVVLELRADPASSLAHAEEVGDAIRAIRAQGKKVLCHLEDAGGRSLFVCSQADRIAMNPAGGLRFAGLSSSYMYYGGLLQKLGVKADFVRVAEHKLAAEQFTNTHGSAVAEQDHRALLEAIERIYLHDVGGGRGIPAAELKKRIAKGPFLAAEARDAGLIDTLAYEDEIDRVVEEMMGTHVRVVRDNGFPTAPTWWGAPAKVAVVYLSGDMVDGESQNIPLVGIKLAGSYTIAGALRRAREDSTVKAVVFRIETGGGSSLAADVILREAILTAKAKPFIVSMGTSAASGGYYSAVAGQPIFANRGTITGSIGIFYGKVDITGLLGKLGVGVDTLRTAPRADAESIYRPYTDDEKRELGVKVKQFYDLFIARVAEGRHMKPEDIDAIARGRVWLGAEAMPLHLVDRIGGLREALLEARQRANLPEDAPLVEFPEDEESLLGQLAKLAGITAAGGLPAGAASFVIPPVLMDMARALSPFLIFDGTKPLARLELCGDVSFGGAPAAVDDGKP
jgi:protease-4